MNSSSLTFLSVSNTKSKLLTSKTLSSNSMSGIHCLSQIMIHILRSALHFSFSAFKDSMISALCHSRKSTPAQRCISFIPRSSRRSEHLIHASWTLSTTEITSCGNPCSLSNRIYYSGSKFTDIYLMISLAFPTSRRIFILCLDAVQNSESRRSQRHGESCSDTVTIASNGWLDRRTQLSSSSDHQLLICVLGFILSL